MTFFVSQSKRSMVSTVSMLLHILSKGYLIHASEFLYRLWWAFFSSFPQIYALREKQSGARERYCWITTLGTREGELAEFPNRLPQ